MEKNLFILFLVFFAVYLSSKLKIAIYILDEVK